ncbi:MAG: hypothetical protein RSE54_10720 [Ruthenibacterium sp.]
MLKEINLLITTLGYTEDYLDATYYDYTYKNGEVRFCTGISNAEAGTKHILCLHQIDEIVVIGPPDVAGAAIPLDPRPLSQFGFSHDSDLDDFSEFDFFCYRISQYISKIDIEATDILHYGSAGRMQELKDLVKKTLDSSPDGYFYQAATDHATYDKLASLLAGLPDSKDARMIKHLLYLEMSPAYKMYSLRANQEVAARFVPIEKNRNGGFSVENMTRIVNSIIERPAQVINIHMDLQGMDKADSYTIWSMLSMASSANTKIQLKTMICTHHVEDHLVNRIDNEIKRYNIEIMLAGMRSFVKYGKADILEEYFTLAPVEYPPMDQLLCAMKHIDAGVSLCNLSDLKYGIQSLKMLFRATDATPDNSESAALFMLLKSGIQHDYAALLEGEEVDVLELIAWALRKQFYQQALTIIESLVPRDVVHRGIFYYAREDADLAKVKEAWNLLFWNESPKNRFFFNDVDHYFIKSYGRGFINFRQEKSLVNKDFAKSRVEQLYNKNPEMCKAYSNLNDDDLLYDFFLSYYNIGNLRNQVSHAQISEKVLPNLEGMKKNETFQLCGETISKFLGLYQAACRKVDMSNTCKPKTMEDWQFKAYTTNHRLQPLQTAPENLLVTDTYNCQFNGKDVQIAIRMLSPEDNTIDD